jgi:hypothetical protein
LRPSGYEFESYPDSLRPPSLAAELTLCSSVPGSLANADQHTAFYSRSLLPPNPSPCVLGDLRPTGSGPIGLCPFHDDHHPSFGVNDEGNYWNCFAGCGGGSGIDFWTKWRRCDSATAIQELADVLL